jgi:hypothetical protein
VCFPSMGVVYIPTQGAWGTRVVDFVLGWGIVRGCPVGNWGESDVVIFESGGIPY